jgi:hypothetical protein
MDTNTVNPQFYDVYVYVQIPLTLNTFPLTEDKKKKELNNIKHIAEVNGYSEKTIEKLNLNTEQNLGKENKDRETTGTQQKTRVAVTYTGPYIRTVMNIFKDTNIQITYKPTNKIDNYLTSKKKNRLKTSKTVEYMN